MTNTARRKPVYRLWWFWLLALVLVYLVVGSGLVPIYLASAIPQRMEQHLGWSVDTGDVSFNPFTFTVSVDELQATDDDGVRILDVDEVSLNLGLVQLVRGTAHIERLELNNPFLRIDLLPGHRLAIVEDWRTHNPDDDGVPLDVLLGNGVINGGRLQVRRFAAGEDSEPREFDIEALGLTLSDVASWERDEPGEYRLQAAMGELVLDSQGTLSLGPLWVNGQVSVSDASADALRPWLGPYLPWSMHGGRLSLETAFQFAYDEQGVALATREGGISARGLELADPGQPDDVLARAGVLDLEGVAFNLDGPELVISRVTGEELHLDAVLSNEEGLNLTRALRERGDDQAGRNAPMPFRWSVGRVDISKSTIDWYDRRPDNPVQLALAEVELNLGAMTEQLEEPVSYQARAALAEGGTASANGQFTLAPLTFEGGLNLDQLVLAPFNGYLHLVSELAVQEGTLNLSGNIDIDVQDDPLTGTFSGRGSISHFSGSLPDEEDPTVAWRELRLDPIEYNFSPARLELGTVTLSEPELSVAQYPDRRLNLVRLLTPGDASGPGGEAGEASAGGDTTGPDLIFRLRQLELANAEVRYTDHTPRPSFRTRLHDLEASVAGLSNITPQQGRFSLRGTLDDSGELQASGALTTLGTNGRSEVDVSLEGLSLPVLSPYFGYYLGFRVDSGKLSGEGHYELQGTEINATNTLVLERLELGEAVQSDAAVTAPVQLGLALLRDGEGRITLEIPVSGDIADPEFNLGPVMMRTLRASLVKAATSPFNLLGALVDLGDYSPDQLGGVAFLAGETTLEMGEYTKMETVAQALDARDRLVLAIRGVALESVDLPALEAQTGEEETLPDGALPNLAAQRGITLKSLLVDEYGVSEEQIFLRAPEVRTGDDEDNSVTIEFELEVR